jgi:hypothetical protein
MKNTLSLREIVDKKAAKVVNIGGSGSISIPGWTEMTRQQREKAYAARDLPVKFLSIERDACLTAADNGAVDLWRRVKMGEVSHFMAEKVGSRRARGVMHHHTERVGLKTWGPVDERMVELLEKHQVGSICAKPCELTPDTVEIIRAFYAWLCRVFPMVEESGEILECWLVDAPVGKSVKRAKGNALKNGPKTATGLHSWAKNTEGSGSEVLCGGSKLYVACTGRPLYKSLHTLAHEYKHALQKIVEGRRTMGKLQETTADNFGWYAVELWLNDVYGKLRITERKRRQAARRH